MAEGCERCFDHTEAWVRSHPCSPFFFAQQTQKTLSERGAQAPVDVVDVGALSESEFGACLHPVWGMQSFWALSKM